MLRERRRARCLSNEVEGLVVLHDLVVVGKPLGILGKRVSCRNGTSFGERYVGRQHFVGWRFAVGCAEQEGRG